MNVTNVSSITAADLAEFIRIPNPDVTDTSQLTVMLEAAKAYMSSYTGRSAAELDEHPDFVTCCLVLVQDMWDNRCLYVDKGTVSMVVQSILDLHSVNLL